MAFELIKSSFQKILHPTPLDFSPVIVGILVASILVKCYMYFYNHRIGGQIKSAAMQATATDSLSDCIATGAVLFATLLSHFTGLLVDGWCGILVGIFVCMAGIDAAKDTINPLLGQAPEASYVKAIEDIVLSHETILGVHDLIVHNYGPGRTLISLHAEVPADGDILEIHDLIDRIEHELSEKLGCHAVIHMDPLKQNDVETDKLKELVLKIVSAIDDRLTIHDFRIVQGPTHTNIIFDVVTPYQFPLSDQELKKKISAMLQQENPSYYASIDVDKQMV